MATDTEYVRSRLAQYANDLLSLGVDGFRLDAAKSKGVLINHDGAGGLDVKSLLDIAASDIANITSRFSSSDKYITQEVIYGGVVDPNEYVNIGEFSVHPW